jgi:hypothetical protein
MSSTNSPEHDLAWFLAEHLLLQQGAPADAAKLPPCWVSAEIQNPVLARLVASGVDEIVVGDQRLQDALAAARPDDAAAEPDPSTLPRIQAQLQLGLQARPDLVDALRALLPRTTTTMEQPSPRLGQGLRRWFRGSRFAAAALLTFIVATVLMTNALFAEVELGSLSLIDMFAIVVVSFLPGWLFVRFLAYRAGPLWNEYVLNLYRLGIDHPRHLPRPPETSMYYERWRDANGWIHDRAPTIYQQKFDAYYGKNVSRTADDQDVDVQYETLFPVLLGTAVTAAGWVMVFRSELPSGTLAPDRLSSLLVFAFLGAYLFNLQTFMRRFFQGDLKASAYAAAAVRVTTALIVVAVLFWLPQPELRGQTGAVVAFVVGFFPLVGLQILTRLASAVLRIVVPTLRSDYPLSEIEGLNLWYEARLLEEGIEDMQNLVTTSVVDVMLHTRVPVGRLVDWIDQAVLYTSLPRSERLATRVRRRSSAKELAKELRSQAQGVKHPSALLDLYESRHPRTLLRRCGIRTATSFVTIFHALEAGETSGAVRGAAPEAAARAAFTWLRAQDPTWTSTLVPLTYVLAGETALEPVWAWRCWRDPRPDLDTASCHNGALLSARDWSTGRGRPPLAAAS